MVTIKFAAESFPLMWHFWSWTMQFVERPKGWPNMATDLYLWGKIQGWHNIRSERLLLMRLFLSISQQLGAFAQFWPNLVTGLAWHLTSNPRSSSCSQSNYPGYYHLDLVLGKPLKSLNFNLFTDLDLWGQTEGCSFVSTPEWWGTYMPKIL